MLGPLSQYRERIETTLGVERLKKRLEERRHRRFLWLFDLPKEGAVLDISCGDGDFLSTIHTHFPDLKLYGIDMSEKIIERAKKKCPSAEFAFANAESIPHKDGIFDASISCMALHHYAKPQEIFLEVTRILVTGGRFYLVDFMPLNRLSRMLHNWDGCPEPYHFEKYYLKHEIESIAKKAGLAIEGYKPLSRFWGQYLLIFRKIC